MHLLDSYGLSMEEIEKDGFKIHEKIFSALDGYNNITTAKSLGILLQSVVDLIQRIKPTWIVLAGDRGETMIAAIAGAYSSTPLAHIQAGELSGLVDGQARHAIGKFANLHFASNLDAQKRLIKLGEEKFRIKLVGAPQLDDLHNKKFNYNDLKQFKKKYNLDLKKKFILSVFHPPQQKIESTKKTLATLFNFYKKQKLQRIWISPNNDTGSLTVKSEFNKLRDNNDFVFDNLSRREYLTLLKNCECIIGNSSSGILESSTFKTPCINIGYRQHGRLRAKNVIDIGDLTDRKLKLAFKKISSTVFRKKLSKIKNPYGDGRSSERIVNLLLNTDINDRILFKKLTY
jgi:GDP/UDP-N,N'-diacetylbacillosamine 2-epimerase (hydrolysing)